jgi:hypothetical protein
MSWALVGAATGWAGVAFLAGAFLGGAGRAPVRPFSAGATVGAAAGAAGAADPAAASMVARSRRATGASIVLDADLTYSPIS